MGLGIVRWIVRVVELLVVGEILIALDMELLRGCNMVW
jgi:hypothetical protein